MASLRRESVRTKHSDPMSQKVQILLLQGEHMASVLPSLSSALQRKALQVADDHSVPIARDQLIHLCQHCGDKLPCSPNDGNSMWIQRLDTRKTSRMQHRAHERLHRQHKPLHTSPLLRHPKPTQACLIVSRCDACKCTSTWTYGCIEQARKDAVSLFKVTEPLVEYPPHDPSNTPSCSLPTATGHGNAQATERAPCSQSELPQQQQQQQWRYLHHQDGVAAEFIARPEATPHGVQKDATTTSVVPAIQRKGGSASDSPLQLEPSTGPRVEMQSVDHLNTSSDAREQEAPVTQPSPYALVRGSVDLTAEVDACLPVAAEEVLCSQPHSQLTQGPGKRNSACLRDSAAGIALLGGGGRMLDCSESVPVMAEARDTAQPLPDRKGSIHESTLLRDVAMQKRAVHGSLVQDRSQADSEPAVGAEASESPEPRSCVHIPEKNGNGCQVERIELAAGTVSDISMKRPPRPTVQCNPSVGELSGEASASHEGTQVGKHSRMHAPSIGKAQASERQGKKIPRVRDSEQSSSAGRAPKISGKKRSFGALLKRK